MDSRTVGTRPIKKFTKDGVSCIVYEVSTKFSFSSRMVNKHYLYELVVFNQMDGTEWTHRTSLYSNEISAAVELLERAQAWSHEKKTST